MTTKRRDETEDGLPSPFAMTALPLGGSKQEMTLPSAQSASGDLEGRILAQRYELERRLGYGGMGTVYLATHLGLDIKVAVKVLHESLTYGEEHKRRFWREAHAASSLTHPNVVRVIDFGSEGNLTFLVMEYLAGRSLGHFIDDCDGALPLPLIQTICVQLLDGLEAAHTRGIVHRDLKPDNVFLLSSSGAPLTADVRDVTVKILDFGLAHVDAPNDPGTLTLTTHVAGTPAYMSPEQCRSLAVGPSTDLYAFGCMLHELLTGAPPFSSTAQVDLMAKHLFAPPPDLVRPSGLEPVPALLDKLRRDLLAKDPEQRPETAAIVKERLLVALDPERARAELPERSQPVHRPREERMPRWTDPAPAPVSATDAPATGTRVAVHDLALGEPELLALRAVGLSPDPGGTEPGVVLLGPDSLEPFPARIARWRHLGPVLCVTTPSPDELRALIAAGAADVVDRAAGFEGVTRKLLRLARRRR